MFPPAKSNGKHVAKKGGSKGAPFHPGSSPVPPSKGKKPAPGQSDPILGLKNALKAEEAGALSAQVAKGGGF